MPPKRPAELDVKRLRDLFAELDAELDGRNEPVRVLVAGGAALAFRWSGRTTYDVDLLGGDFPADLRRAIAVVAERHNLESDWVNAGAVVGNAAFPREPTPRRQPRSPWSCSSVRPRRPPCAGVGYGRPPPPFSVPASHQGCECRRSSSKGESVGQLLHGVDGRVGLSCST